MIFFSVNVTKMLDHLNRKVWTCEYLKEFRHGYYMELLLEGKLNEYLHDIDEECYEMLDRIVEQMKVKQGVTEQLKAENQMLWVGKMNNIIACAEEVVVREVVYV